MEREAFIIGPDDPILVTGATGFIGVRLVESLLDHGFRNVVCFARPSSEVATLEAIRSRRCQGTRMVMVKGNLLSREDCAAATKDVAVIFHLAAGGDEKSFPDAFMNSVVTRAIFSRQVCGINACAGSSTSARSRFIPTGRI